MTDIKTILKELKDLLKQQFGDKIKEVILFGSQAEGNACAINALFGVL